MKALAKVYRTEHEGKAAKNTKTVLCVLCERLCDLCGEKTTINLSSVPCSK